MARLDERDRRFFARVAEAAFSNPFSRQRELIDGELAEADAAHPAVLERLAARLAGRLAGLAKGSVVRLDDYRDQDRELLFAALLFHYFHRYLSDLDELIAREERERTPPRVRFASALFAELVPHGIPATQAVRLLELFFQMRRAHLAVRLRLDGGGASMRRVREELWNALFTRDIRRYERHLWNRLEDFSTLLVGETGTGKGEAAQALGRSAFIAFDDKREVFRERSADLFVPVNLSEFPETLIESELFGHKKGAFTGAIDQHEGVLARVRAHGTVFLDEIGEISLPIQVKLLRVLQERVFTPVGGHEPRRFLGRVVAATHRSFEQMRASGTLRDDFYYRLCTNVIELPPLRQRITESPAELPLLVQRIVDRIVGEPAPELAADVLRSVRRDLGEDYAFPGNVRELEQCVRRVLLAGACPPFAESQSVSLKDVSEATVLSAHQVLQRHCAELYVRSRSYVEVARLTGLDRRTVKKHVLAVRGRPA